MAKKTLKLLEAGSPQWSWRRFFIATSVTLNIGFIVVIITMATTNGLDGMFMNEGLQRYCLTVNDGRFEDTTKMTRALRDYTCERSDAAAYFKEGFHKYLDYKNIPYLKNPY